jgi:GT2 family glycosyltransferase/2-polyprenyl-3-methyl-5-hydroxy-6-metoxy-1,4-benzoquinol methylase
MTTTAGKYSVFDDAPGSTHNLVVELVPSGANVLEFGCATGYMSAVLRKRLGCHVTGIEIDPAAAELARSRAERVIVGDAEQLDYELELGDERFEVILFADVLEHLREPSAVLRRVRPLLATGGSIVASIPNVAHGSVRVALLGGEFRYNPYGLLDDTHLRFFTRDSVLSLFEDAGYVVTEWQRKGTPIDQTEVVGMDIELPEPIRERLESDPDATTYQFIVKAARAEDVDGVRSVRAELGALRADVEVRDAAIRKLQAALAQQTEASARARRIADERETTLGELRESLHDREALHGELREIRQLLGKQFTQMRALAREVTASAERDARLEQSLARVHEDILLRQDDVQASLYDVRGLVARSGATAADARADEYQQTIRRVQEAVRRIVPRAAVVLVVSRGDDALLHLFGRTGRHFPRRDDGLWAGEYPATSGSAIAQLEWQRAERADFLIFPKPAFWWLDFYGELARHLEHHYQAVHRDDACVVYDVRQPQPAVRSVWQVFENAVAMRRSAIGDEPAILDWNTGLDIATRFPLLTVFSPPPFVEAELPYVDRSVSVVALATRDTAVVAEARRVASGAILTFSGSASGDLAVEIERIEQPGAGAPAKSASVSMVIPCFNNSACTAACLRAVQETLPDHLAVEIIVVDDGSTDDTSAVVERSAARDRRVRLVRNPTNLGFIASCNRGAEVARHELLVFLNNDTVPLSGWLEAVLQVFRDEPRAGVVGGKLLYPDGRLQEAGGVVFADGSAANFGRGEYDVEAATFNFVREIDYCSGALLATPRALFTALGGFDRRYSPAYYEDTDYCFAVRAHGYRVLYQPRSRIVHREGASSGTDLAAGVKRHQVVNQTRFARKWSAILATQPKRPPAFDVETWYSLLARTPGSHA